MSSTIVAGTCCICGKTGVRKLTKKKGGSCGGLRVICKDWMAHKDCLNDCCVVCYDYIDEAYRVCIGCGAKVHNRCVIKDSRRPPSRQTGHHWADHVQVVDHHEDVTDDY